jgi:hypothetical protein
VLQDLALRCRPSQRNAYSCSFLKGSSTVFDCLLESCGAALAPAKRTEYEAYWRAEATKADAKDDVAAAQAAHTHADNAKAFGEHLQGITGQYQISYIELDKDLAVDKVCDIFTQINSRGIRLDVFDLVNALLKPKGLGLKQMWRDASARLEDADTEKMNVYILQVMSILRQGYCSPKYLYFLLPGQEKSVRDPDGSRRKEILIPDAKDFENRWNGAVDTMEGSIKVLMHPQEYGAVKSSFLPYVSILPVFSALRAHARTLPAPRQLDARRKAQAGAGSVSDVPNINALAALAQS